MIFIWIMEAGNSLQDSTIFKLSIKMIFSRMDVSLAYYFNYFNQMSNICYTTCYLYEFSQYQLLIWLLYFSKGYWYNCPTIFTQAGSTEGFCSQYCWTMLDFMTRMQNENKFYLHTDIKFLQLSLTIEEGNTAG